MPNLSNWGCVWNREVADISSGIVSAVFWLGCVPRLVKKSGDMAKDGGCIVSAYVRRRRDLPESNTK